MSDYGGLVEPFSRHTRKKLAKVLEEKHRMGRATPGTGFVLSHTKTKQEKLVQALRCKVHHQCFAIVCLPDGH